MRFCVGIPGLVAGLIALITGFADLYDNLLVADPEGEAAELEVWKTLEGRTNSLDFAEELFDRIIDLADGGMDVKEATEHVIRHHALN